MRQQPTKICVKNKFLFVTAISCFGGTDSERTITNVGVRLRVALGILYKIQIIL